MKFPIWQTVVAIILVAIAFATNAVFERLLVPYTAVTVGMSDSPAQAFGTDLVGAIPYLVWGVVALIIIAMFVPVVKRAIKAQDKEDAR